MPSSDHEVRALIDKLERLANSLEMRVSQALEEGAEILASQVRLRLSEEGRSGRIYRENGVELQASAPGEAPAPRTGRLSNSITVEPGASKGEVRVAADTPYAAALEFGTREAEPRPFLQPALDENREAIKARVRKAARKAAPNTRV